MSTSFPSYISIAGFSPASRRTTSVSLQLGFVINTRPRIHSRRDFNFPPRDVPAFGSNVDEFPAQITRCTSKSRRLAQVENRERYAYHFTHNTAGESRLRPPVYYMIIILFFNILPFVISRKVVRVPVRITIPTTVSNTRSRL